MNHVKKKYISLLMLSASTMLCMHMIFVLKLDASKQKSFYPAETIYGKQHNLDTEPFIESSNNQFCPRCKELCLLLLDPNDNNKIYKSLNKPAARLAIRNEIKKHIFDHDILKNERNRKDKYREECLNAMITFYKDNDTPYYRAILLCRFNGNIQVFLLFRALIKKYF